MLLILITIIFLWLMCGSFFAIFLLIKDPHAAIYCIKLATENDVINYIAEFILILSLYPIIGYKLFNKKKV